MASLRVTLMTYVNDRALNIASLALVQFPQQQLRLGILGSVAGHRHRPAHWCQRESRSWLNLLVIGTNGVDSVGRHRNLHASS